MLTITRDKLTRYLNKDDAPAAFAKSGDIVVFETLDCYNNSLIPENATFDDVPKGLGNPATGPLFVEGAEPGDMLRVSIQKIELGEVGILDRGINCGYFKGQFDHSVINRIRVKDGKLTYKNGFSMDIRPMVGVMGVAPAGEPLRTMTPMDCGGNMDCTCVQEGASVYFPVSVPGALLSMGDLHAVMGEGEVGNCGVEICGRVTVKAEAEKNMRLPFIMIENKEKWMTLAWGEDLDEAAKKATLQMHRFLVEVCGLDADDACMLQDMAGDLIICEVVNPYKTVRMELRRELIARMQALK